MWCWISSKITQKIGNVSNKRIKRYIQQNLAFRWDSLDKYTIMVYWQYLSTLQKVWLKKVNVKHPTFDDISLSTWQVRIWYNTAWFCIYLFSSMLVANSFFFEIPLIRSFFNNQYTKQLLKWSKESKKVNFNKSISYISWFLIYL